MRRKLTPRTWDHVLSAAAVAVMLAVSPGAYAQNEKLATVKIYNSTGNSWGLAVDKNDPRVTMRIGCDGESRDLAAEKNGTCGAVSISVTPVGPIASKVRMRVSSGRLLDPLTGPFTAGTVTFRTSPNNPKCTKSYPGEDVWIGGHIDDNDLTDMQVLKDGLWYVTIKHRCRR